MKRKNTDINIDIKTKEAYSKFSKPYVEYADGKLESLYDFTNRQYSYSDKVLWDRIKSVIFNSLLKKRAINILDIGCGPGTWALRIFDTFRSLNVDINIVGIDISSEMISIARKRKEKYISKNGLDEISINYFEHDINTPLPFKDNEFDISLSLYTVLNHIKFSNVIPVVKEVMRCTSTTNIITVKSNLGNPTAYVCSMNEIEYYKQHNDILEFKHKDNYKGIMRSHLFDYKELKMILSTFSKTEIEITGLDLVFSKLSDSNLPISLIKKIEEMLCSDFAWINYANHLMFITHKKIYHEQ